MDILLTELRLLLSGIINASKKSQLIEINNVDFVVDTVGLFNIWLFLIDFTNKMFEFQFFVCIPRWNELLTPKCFWFSLVCLD